MGAAKQRGTFEERKEAARIRIDQATAKMAENLKQLDAAEAQSEKVRNEVAAKMVNAFMAARERERLGRMGIRIGSKS